MLALHNIDKLRAYFADLSQGLGVDEVLLSPFVVILMHTPLLVDIKQSQMITFWNLEMLSGSIALLLPVFLPEEYRRNT